MQYRDYLGVAVAHPATINAYGQQALVEDSAAVRQSIRRILDTPVGSEFMNRAYGSHLRLLLHEPNDALLQSLLEYQIQDAITTWEKRVRYLSTDFEVIGAEQLNCRVNYQLVTTAEPESYVYPFYREARY